MGWFFGSDEGGEEQQLCNHVIGAAFSVRRELGGRFDAEVYREALNWELRQRSVSVKAKPALVVKYQGRPVGEFRPDLLVGERVLVELESSPKLTARRLDDARRALAAARISRGVVLNFGAPKLEYRRVEAA